MRREFDLKCIQPKFMLYHNFTPETGRVVTRGEKEEVNLKLEVCKRKKLRVEIMRRKNRSEDTFLVKYLGYILVLNV